MSNGYAPTPVRRNFCPYDSDVVFERYEDEGANYLAIIVHGVRVFDRPAAEMHAMAQVILEEADES